MDLQTAYGVLGVRPGASEVEVRAAHQQLSAMWQPARFQQDPAQRQHAEAMFAQINQALDAIARARFPSNPPTAFAPPSSPPPSSFAPPSGPPPFAPPPGYSPTPGASPYAPPQPGVYPPPNAPPYGAPGQPYPPGSPAFGPGAPNPFAPDPEAERARKRSRAFAQLGIGLLLLIVGAAITASTHQSAVQRGGGTYIIAYGPIIFGVVSFFRGLFGLLSA